MDAPTSVCDVTSRLGEGPLWHESEDTIYWVDIEGRAIHRHWLMNRQTQTFAMPERIGCIARRSRGGLVAGLQSGFAWVDLKHDTVTPIIDPEAGQPDNRFNDGKCDAHGRFWAGTMDTLMRGAAGVLYRLDPDGSVHAMDDGYGITNGPAWSPNGTVMYHNDSKARTVYAFDCDPAAGTIDNKRVLVELQADEGFPDGLTVDSEGGIWLAHWGGSRVTRYLPNGQIDRVIEMPVSQVTSCAFGGRNMRTLFITSASIGLSEEQLAHEPLAGRLFSVDVDIAGLPANSYAG
ncbi:MAG: sugar lactone lactonase YvrE [Planctomycetota bacterium]|jgi:sugar lactone lactonase YvrE